MISGSVSGVVGCLVLVGCDAVPGATKGCGAYIFSVKQLCWTVQNV